MQKTVKTARHRLYCSVCHMCVVCLFTFYHAALLLGQVDSTDSQHQHQQYQQQHGQQRFGQQQVSTSTAQWLAAGDHSGPLDPRPQPAAQTRPALQRGCSQVIRARSVLVESPYLCEEQEDRDLWRYSSYLVLGTPLRDSPLLQLLLVMVTTLVAGRGVLLLLLLLEAGVVGNEAVTHKRRHSPSSSDSRWQPWCQLRSRLQQMQLLPLQLLSSTSAQLPGTRSAVTAAAAAAAAA